jgi:hypothetical protein
LIEELFDQWLASDGRGDGHLALGEWAVAERDRMPACG